MMQWHTLPAEEIFLKTGSSPHGLSSQKVEEQLAAHGKNVLEEKQKKPVWMLFLRQFKDFMILVLVVAAIVSGIAGDRTDMFIILVIVLLNAIMGFVQEYRAEKAMEALKKMATPAAVVIRDGAATTLSSEDVVPGDLVLVEAGNTIPADIRLLESHSLRVEESSLTGESVPVDKTTEPLSGNDIPLGDRLNMAFKGTQVTNGRGKGIVVATGMKTELGQIAQMLQTAETTTPLQKRMTDFGKKLSYLIIGLCVVLFGLGLLRGEDTVKMLLLAISLAVAAIPEALPALITIALARGAKRMVEKNALIRKLPAVETLGSVTFICTDKTGTLTRNKMTVVAVQPSASSEQPKEGMDLLHLSMLLNHDVQKNKDGQWLGDPTEIAMVEKLETEQKDVSAILKEFPRVGELPFDSDRKCMTTIHKTKDGHLVISKGAAESIAKNLRDGSGGKELLDHADKMAAEGMRVLAFGYRLMPELPQPVTIDNTEAELEFAGLVGMIDPPREEIKEAIRECNEAGIHPVMITGDHKETASAIAKQIGILRKEHLVVTGSDLAHFSEDDFMEKVERIRVYARVSPRQKLDIVTALQKKTHFVAMTGDGVNDAPSLKTANIGIAMGITGTDVSKEAAHMILLDDNFATIVKAVREGRRIYDNIRKFVKYIMTCNSAEIWTIFLAPLIGLPIPLLPIHILWINLVTDGLPGLALSAEKAESNIMQRPPRKTNESLFAGGVAVHIVWVGILMAAITLATQAWAIGQDNPRWQTMVFTVLSLAQLGHVSAIRSEHEYIFRKGFFSNMPLVWALLFTFLLQMAIIYLPAANTLFKTQPLTFSELLICIGLSMIVFIAVEIEKWVKKTFGKRKVHTARHE